MIVVELPAHLRTLAGATGPVELDVTGEATIRGVLDALERRFPNLRGTVREIDTQKRRAYVRFFACERDLSHDDPDLPLPGAVARGDAPFTILGAISGG